MTKSGARKERTDLATRPTQRTRWFQFRLGTLLALVSVLGVWLGIHTEATRKQRHAVQALKAVGGTVRYDYEYLGKPSRIPEWLRRWLGDDFFSQVYDVDLEGRQVTDAALEPLSDLRNLRSVLIQETSVTDAGLAHLAGLTTIENLSLYANDINGRGLSHLRNWQRLSYLTLNQTPFADEGAEHLAKLQGLECLYLGGTNIGP